MDFAGIGINLNIIIDVVHRRRMRGIEDENSNDRDGKWKGDVGRTL